MNTLVNNPDEVISVATQMQTQAQQIANSSNTVNSLLGKVKAAWISTTADVNSYTSELGKLQQNISSNLVPAINKIATTAIQFAEKAKATAAKSAD